MNVPSPGFLLFAALAALAFNFWPSLPWRRAVLLVTNVVFLASFASAPLAVLPLVAFVALGYAAHLLTVGRGADFRFVALLVLLVAAFAWIKRYSFVPAGAFLPFPYLLIGLSYVFFRVAHVVIDGCQGAIPGRIGLLSYVNYTMNFACLVSGPIQLYQPYSAMETERLPLDLPVIGVALERIVVGYMKVAIVSTALAVAQHGAIGGLLAGGGFAARVGNGALAAALYPIYLYFNFSGYVDVVVGVARFFRIVLPENFDRPFSSESFIILWSRWHMTLSGWLKAYVFNPIMLAALSRVTAPALAPYVAVFAFFVTFFLVGLWHGQTSEFLAFGVLQGGGVAANKLYQIKMADLLGRKGYRALAASTAYRTVGRGLTFTYFAFTLFWFWSSWPQMSDLCGAAGPAGLACVWLVVFAGSTVLLAVGEELRAAVLAVQWQRSPLVRSRYVRTAWSTALAAITVATTVLLNAPAPEIVYKAF